MSSSVLHSLPKYTELEANPNRISYGVCINCIDLSTYTLTIVPWRADVGIKEMLDILPGFKELKVYLAPPKGVGN